MQEETKQEFGSLLERYVHSRLIDLLYKYLVRVHVCTCNCKMEFHCWSPKECEAMKLFITSKMIFSGEKLVFDDVCL